MLLTAILSSKKCFKPRSQIYTKNFLILIILLTMSLPAKSSNIFMIPTFSFRNQTSSQTNEFWFINSNLATLGGFMLLLGQNPLIETSLRIGAGHIRYFTYKSLNQLLTYHRLKSSIFLMCQFNNRGLSVVVCRQTLP